MQVKEILELACVFLGMDEVLEDEYFTGNPEGGDDSTEKEISKLLKCLNLIVNEISSDYLPLLTEEDVVFNDEKLYYTELDKTILEVFSLKDFNGRAISFKTFPEYISANVQNALLTYSFQPQELEQDDVIIYYGGKIPPRVYAYGVAMEYLFISSQSDEAHIWEKRYKDCLCEIVRKKSETKLPSRRWI